MNPLLELIRKFQHPYSHPIVISLTQQECHLLVSALTHVYKNPPKPAA